MRRAICALAILTLIQGFAVGEDAPYYRDLFSDTWVATDALGRKMPLHDEVGPVKTDQRRVVGIFYITWHTHAAR